MTDRGFTHPNFGNEARVEQYGREVHLIFVAGTSAQADSLAESIVSQLQAGAINITMMGKPTAVHRS
jgi:hypothetical protein